MGMGFPITATTITGTATDTIGPIGTSSFTIMAMVTAITMAAMATITAMGMADTVMVMGATVTVTAGMVMAAMGMVTDISPRH